MKTTITEEWSIGTWEQRDMLSYESITEKIGGVSANCCVGERQKPSHIEYDDSTGVLYRKYESGRSAIFKRTYSPAVNIFATGIDLSSIERVLEEI